VTIKIHEVISFSQELDLLEAHLYESQQWVDKIFVKESTESWSGKKDLPLLFSDNKERFKEYNKAEVMILPPGTYKDVPSSWTEDVKPKMYNLVRDNLHINRHYNWNQICEGADFVLSHDCDEIINHNKADIIRTVLEQNMDIQMFSYNLYRINNYVNNFNGSARWLRGYNANMPIPTSEYRKYKRLTIDVKKVSGWHLTNCFFPDGLRTKADLMTAQIGYLGRDDVKELDYYIELFEKNMSGGNPISREEFARIGPGFISDNIHLFPHKFLDE
jgi:hypothetical protein